MFQLWAPSKVKMKLIKQNLFMNSKVSLLLAFSVIFVLGCTGKQGETITPFKKFVNTGKTSQQKVDKKASKEALTDGVLVDFDQDSTLKSATADGVAFGARLKVNTKFPIYWNHTFKLKVGQSLGPIQLDSSHGLGDLDLSLSVLARRVNKSDKKNTQGHLILQYELKQTKDDADLSKKSYLLAIIDLNRLKSTKPLYKTEVLYPVPDDFLLEEWIDKNLK